MRLLKYISVIGISLLLLFGAVVSLFNLNLSFSII